MVFVIVTHGWVVESMNKHFFRKSTRGFKVDFCSFNLARISDQPNYFTGRYELKNIIQNKIAYKKTIEESFLHGAMKTFSFLFNIN